MVAAFLSRLTILVMGILYPAYSSFKAVRRKSHRDYTKWMMYWIVFALFQAVEMVTDTFLPWLPLYYEAKILFVLWLVLPITEGSKQMYRLIIHPFLLKHEEKIDQGIAHAGKTGLETLRRVSQAGLNKAATTVVTSAIKGQTVLTETLLRAQESNLLPQQVPRSQGTDQTDQPEPIPPASTSPLGDGVFQRTHPSSSDFEPFEVINEEEEDAARQASVSDGVLWESTGQQQQEAQQQVWSTTNTNTNNSKKKTTYSSTDSEYYSRTVPEETQS